MRFKALAVSAEWINPSAIVKEMHEFVFGVFLFCEIMRFCQSLDLKQVWPVVQSIARWLLLFLMDQEISRFDQDKNHFSHQSWTGRVSIAS